MASKLKMMKGAAQFKGGGAIAAKFMQLADIGARKELAGFTDRKAKGLKGEIKREISAKIKRRTGDLGKAVVSHKDKYAVKDFVSQIVRMDTKKAYYAYWVEYGHGGPHPAPAHPYFRPVVLRSEGKLNREIMSETQKVIKKIARE